MLLINNYVGAAGKMFGFYLVEVIWISLFKNHFIYGKGHKKSKSRVFDLIWFYIYCFSNEMALSK